MLNFVQVIEFYELFEFYWIIWSLLKFLNGFEFFDMSWILWVCQIVGVCQIVWIRLNSVFFVEFCNVCWILLKSFIKALGADRCVMCQRYRDLSHLLWCSLSHGAPHQGSTNTQRQREQPERAAQTGTYPQQGTPPQHLTFVYFFEFSWILWL